MLVRTTRFGTVEIPDNRVISFPKGLLGFQSQKQFCLLEPGNDSAFLWLQSLDEPSLAFVVTDPSMFYKDYEVPIKPEQMQELELQQLSDAQVFVIVNKVDQVLTGNLQGPLVINTLTRQGEQIVLADKRWTTRHHLVSVGEERSAAKAMSA